MADQPDYILKFGETIEVCEKIEVGMVNASIECEWHH